MTPRDGERIELLLAELEQTTGPQTWARIQELVQRLVEMQGEALRRLLPHAKSSSTFHDDLAGDELLAGLLLLHDLHPLPLEERIEAALAKVRPLLLAHAGGVEWLGRDPDGAGRIRLLGKCNGCPSSRATVEGTIRAALEALAPERDGLRIAEEQRGGLRLPVLREAR